MLRPGIARTRGSMVIHTTTAMHEIDYISPIEYTPPPPTVVMRIDTLCCCKRQKKQRGLLIVARQKTITAAISLVPPVSQLRPTNSRVNRLRSDRKYTKRFDSGHTTSKCTFTFSVGLVGPVFVSPGLFVGRVKPRGSARLG